MKKMISCRFNIDTACVELKYADGSMISITCRSDYPLRQRTLARNNLIITEGFSMAS